MYAYMEQVKNSTEYLQYSILVDNDVREREVFVGEEGGIY